MTRDEIADAVRRGLSSELHEAGIHVARHWKPFPSTLALELEDGSAFTVVVKECRQLGRPTVMTKERRAEYVELLRQGFSRPEASRTIGVSRSTTFHWTRRHPEFGAECDAAEQRRRTGSGSIGGD